jgi:CBS domain-containing protein
MKANDVMTAPALVTLSSSIAAAAQAMCDADVSLLPVVDDIEARRLQGVITDRDILERCVSARHRSGCRVGDHMTRHPLITVGPDDPLDEVFQRMENARIRRAPVVERDGRVVGVVTLDHLSVRAEVR